MNEGIKIPASVQARERIRRDIIAGVFPSDQPLPPMAVLGQVYDMGRLTVRSGLKMLEEEGIVRIRQGAGTFINEDMIPPREAAELTGGVERAYSQAVSRLSSFLSDPTISNDSKARLIQILDGQMSVLRSLNSN